MAPGESSAFKEIVHSVRLPGIADRALSKRLCKTPGRSWRAIGNSLLSTICQKNNTHTTAAESNVHGVFFRLAAT